jgi:hypothetical protein
MDPTLMRDLARSLLEGVRLQHFIGDDGTPAPACWERLAAGTLSSGERVMVALAMALVDYQMPSPPTVDRLVLLDRGNLARVALGALACA